MERADFRRRQAVILFLDQLHKMGLTKRRLKYYYRQYDFEWEK